MSLLRTLRTIRYLKPTQLAFFVLRRKFAAKTLPVRPSPAISSTIRLQAPIDVSGGFIDADESGASFEYLNQRKSFAPRIDWTAADMPRLWGYNLHYFDYLRNPDISVQNRLRLIEDWMESNPQGAQPGWEPFTTSLRIVNWINFLVAHPQCAGQPILDSLYLQTCWLEKNDERHILANHYFENLKALLFAGVYFTGSDAERWRVRATSELAFQLKEQILPDGGHYERSPQYHSLMLENYLDLLNLVLSNSSAFDSQFEGQVLQAAKDGLRWLEDIVFPDGKIPLFNDSAFGIAPSLQHLAEYATRLFGYECHRNDALLLVNRPDTGLYGVRAARDMLLMDCGELGPAYQPGHSHCDFLSYELMVGDRRLVVDTGVCEYAPGETRHYLRSTAAHNTVGVDGLEQSEIWGEFRVARRAKKREAAILREGENLSISGAYDGFYGTGLLDGPRYRHTRQINVKLVKERIRAVSVIDTLSPLKNRTKPARATSYIHLHPDIVVEAQSDASLALFAKGCLLARIIPEVPAGLDVSVELSKSIYCPEFGIKQENQCVEIVAAGVFPEKFGYRLELVE